MSKNWFILQNLFDWSWGGSGYSTSSFAIFMAVEFGPIKKGRSKASPFLFRIVDALAAPTVALAIGTSGFTATMSTTTVVLIFHVLSILNVIELMFTLIDGDLQKRCKN
ncbi:hypothetical protein [Flagellimonas myxillae]|uniref:hypothetical protein n=1 Tax=Flagellimonas myxillae TaxID=2942214 RepID=UPI00201F73FA|nr:hypothetical protein [Muricauda myxillae]MCL6267209.1 hypothetical protein [Muricauda myxillae]